MERKKGITNGKIMKRRERAEARNYEERKKDKQRDCTGKREEKYNIER
jgi:hypothetical protein